MDLQALIREPRQGINTLLRKYPHALGHAVFGLSGLSLVMSDIAFLRIIAVAANALALADVALDKSLRPIKFKRAHIVRWSKRWNVMFIGIHVVWLYWIAHERFAWLSEEEELMYLAEFKGGGFTRPQFRTLLRKGTAHTASEETALITEASHPDVFLILSSDQAYILAKGRTIRFGVAKFEEGSKEDAAERAATEQLLGRPGIKPIVVGEAGYLSGRLASASVVVEPGCRYVRWRREDLHNLEESEITAELHKRVEVWLGLALSEKLRETTATFVAHEDELEFARSELQALRYESAVRHYVFEASSPAAREVGGGSAQPQVEDLSALLQALQAHRRSMDIADAVHVQAMKRLGLPVATSSAVGDTHMRLNELQRLLLRRLSNDRPPSLDAATAKRAAAKRLFDTIDTDGSGSITRDELAEHFKARQRSDQLLLEHVFTEMDQDGNGLISEAEWCATIDTWMRSTGATLPVPIEHGN